MHFNSESEKYFEMARADHQAGRLGEALQLYDKVLSADPHDHRAWNLKGYLFFQKKDYCRAIELFVEALELMPEEWLYHFNLAEALAKTGETVDAERSYSRACELMPGIPEVRLNYGNFLVTNNKCKHGIEQLLIAKELAPSDPRVDIGLGLAFEKMKKSSEAQKAYRRALALVPDSPEVNYNLASCLHAEGKVEEAISYYRLVHRLSLEGGGSVVLTADNHCNYGVALHETNQHELALAQFKRALALQPDHAEALTNQAYSLLVTGRFREGWQAFESRKTYREISIPRWNGENFEGKSLLILYEQGAGDWIMWARFFSLVKKMGGKVLAICPDSLVRWTMQLGCIDEFISWTTKIEENEAPADMYVPAGSLPFIFGVESNNVPPPAITKAPKATKLQKDVLDIGLCWAGNPTHGRDIWRSVHLREWMPLLEMQGYRWHCFQMGEAASQVTEIGAMGRFDSFLDAGSDYYDTAIKLSEMDLLISVDTSVVHLAGSVEVPAWVLIPFAPDWRWLIEGETSKWYPQAKLFRQSKRGDWGDVIIKLVGELADGAPYQG